MEGGSWKQLRTLVTVVVVFYVAAAPTVNAQGSGACQLWDHRGDAIELSTTYSNDHFLREYYEPLLDNVASGYHYYTYSTGNVQGAEVLNDGLYDIDIDVQEKKMSITTGRNFIFFEETNRSPNQELEIVLHCSNGQKVSLIVYFVLFDTNNHLPALEKNEIVLELPMPLPSGIQLTPCFVEPIKGREIDISSRDIIASVRGAENLLSAEATALNLDTKSFEVKLRTVNILWLVEDFQFDLILTDPGTSDDPNTHYEVSQKITIKWLRN